MGEPWYTLDEIQRWTEADERGFGEHAQWLTDQLNAAFEKGKQLARGEAKTALAVLSADMHRFSTRPCTTCSQVAKAIGEPFGCDELRQKGESRG